MAWTETSDTTVAYGYDALAAQQWFAKLDSTKRFTVSSTYGADGRVLDSRVVNPYSAARSTSTSWSTTWRAGR